MNEERHAVECGELLERVAQEAGKKLGKKWRCPSDLQGQIVAYTVECREGGESLGAISARLGLVESTLARWLRKREKRAGAESSPGFRSVAIVPTDKEQRFGTVTQLRLITADGHIVEGLDVESAAFLLRAIR